jgi:hypothetical protein
VASSPARADCIIRTAAAVAAAHNNDDDSDSNDSNDVNNEADVRDESNAWCKYLYSRSVVQFHFLATITVSRHMRSRNDWCILKHFATRIASHDDKSDKAHHQVLLATTLCNDILNFEKAR